MSSNDAVDYDWLAERFVLDELDEEDCARCERLLETTPAFCDAVGRASELMAAIAEAQSAHTVAVEPQRWRGVLAGMGLGVAASLLVGVGTWSAGILHIGSDGVEIARSNDEGPPEDSQVASRWSGSRFDTASVDGVGSIGEIGLAQPADDHADDTSESITPWIAAVASLPSDEGGSNEGSDDGS